MVFDFCRVKPVTSQIFGGVAMSWGNSLWVRPQLLGVSPCSAAGGKSHEGHRENRDRHELCRAGNSDEAAGHRPAGSVHRLGKDLLSLQWDPALRAARR